MITPHAAVAGGSSGVRSRRGILTLAAAAVSGGLLAASFPPLDLGVLAWFALIPWMLALAGGAGASVRAALASAAVLSVTLHVVACTWMIHVMRVHGSMSWPVALAGYAVGAVTVMPYAALAGLAVATWIRRLGALALLPLVPAWILLDIARSRMVLGFPWYLPGMTQARFPSVLSVADLGGVHAVSALVLLGNVAVACGVLVVTSRGAQRRKAGAATLVAAGLVVAGLAYGAMGRARHAVPRARAASMVLADEGDGPPLPPDPDVDWRAGGSLSVALVQGAVPQEIVLEARPEEDRDRANLALRLTGLALDAGAGLVVWSESSYPATFAQTWPALRLQRLLEAHASPGRRPEVVVGGLVDVWPLPAAQQEANGTSDPGRYTVTNSAVLLDQDGPKGRYDKRYLVPFGEYVPARWFFFWFEQLTRTVGEFRAGSSNEPLAGALAALGTVVCYEAVLAQHVRAVSACGSTVLVNITNDGWFHGTAAPEQHLRFGILRAVESRKWLLRCANSGISAIIAPDGTIVGRMGEGERGVLLSAVEPRASRTPYLALGDVPLAAIGLAVAGAIAATWIARRRAGLPQR